VDFFATQKKKKKKKGNTNIDHHMGWIGRVLCCSLFSLFYNKGHGLPAALVYEYD
jgi:hypothetical protein